MLHISVQIYTKSNFKLLINNAFICLYCLRYVIYIYNSYKWSISSIQLCIIVYLYRLTHEVYTPYFLFVDLSLYIYTHTRFRRQGCIEMDMKMRDKEKVIQLRYAHILIPIYIGMWKVISFSSSEVCRISSYRLSPTPSLLNMGEQCEHGQTRSRKQKV